MTRRILSMLMAFCMIFGMVPASAFALSPTVPSGIDRVVKIAAAAEEA